MNILLKIIRVQIQFTASGMMPFVSPYTLGAFIANMRVEKQTNVEMRALRDGNINFIG